MEFILCLTNVHKTGLVERNICEEETKRRFKKKNMKNVVQFFKCYHLVIPDNQNVKLCYKVVDTYCSMALQCFGRF